MIFQELKTLPLIPICSMIMQLVHRLCRLSSFHMVLSILDSDSLSRGPAVVLHIWCCMCTDHQFNVHNHRSAARDGLASFLGPAPKTRLGMAM